ncbi:MAG: LamG domain-containing protein [Planctomycetota bacterium]
MARVTLLCGALACAVSVCAQNTGVAFSATVDGYVEVPYAPEVVPQSGITVEAWITYDDATLPTGWRYPTIVRQGLSVGGSEDYFLRINADNTGLRILRWKVVTATSAPTVNWNFAAGQLLNWTHVAATYDGTTAALYVNGALVGSAAGIGEPIRDLNNEVFRIGKGSDVATPIEVWNGQIDEVRLWPFARTAAEIQQTMNFALSSVPGRVSTWNLDNHTLDTSGNLNATIAGTVTYTANPLALTALPAPSAFPVGAGTPGCLGPLGLTIGSLPQAGNLAFAPVCTRAPGNAIAFLAMGFGAAAAPWHVAGIDFWLDPAFNVVTLAPTNGLGAARFGVPLPSWLGAGHSFAFQYAFLDPCGPQG